MSHCVYVLVDKSGVARRCGLSLSEVTRLKNETEFLPSEWNSLWAAESPEDRLHVYASKGWQLQEIPVERIP